MPALSGRIRTHLEDGSPERLAAIAPKGVDFELQRQFYDTADAAFAPWVAALTSYVPSTQILFGTDTPYIKAEANVHELQARGLPPSILNAICHDNARRLMPGLRA